MKSPKTKIVKDKKWKCYNTKATNNTGIYLQKYSIYQGLSYKHYKYYAGQFVKTDSDYKYQPYYASDTYSIEELILITEKLKELQAKGLK